MKWLFEDWEQSLYAVWLGFSTTFIGLDFKDSLFITIPVILLVNLFPKKG